MPIKSKKYNDAKGGKNNKVCVDMGRDWSHLSVAMIVSYDKFGCLYMQSRRVSEFSMSGQSVLLFYYLYQCE